MALESQQHALCHQATLKAILRIELVAPKSDGEVTRYRRDLEIPITSSLLRSPSESNTIDPESYYEVISLSGGGLRT